MDSLMLKELVKSRVFPVISIMIGSIFLASCSSGVSRFDFPMFGLSKKDDQAGLTSSLSSGARLGQGADDQILAPDSGGLAGFRDGSLSDNAVAGSSNYNSRSSYLPPQTAAPEVRSARYGVVERSPLASFGRQPARRDLDRRRSSQGLSGNDRYGASYDAQPMKPIREARRSFLPSEPSQYNYNAKAKPRKRPVARSYQQRPVVKTVAPKAVAGGNQMVSVGAGETLYSISRRTNVSVMKLMQVNDLSDSNLSVGQQIIVPGNGVKAAAQTAQSKTSKPIRAVTSGTYTVRPGENFHSIARKLNVSSAKLADINGITDPGSIRAGEVLILPTTKSAPKRTANLVVRKPPVQARGGNDLHVRSVKTKTIKLGSVKPRTTSVGQKQASIATRKSGKKASAVAAFRWPVRGRIIERFGPRGNGTHNDGINLAVPNGTKVKAAEAGVVAYAGSELKGYGNLVLIRHANDWVSAYAHNDKLMVKRGDKIKRGQVVARAGTSGSVDQPQVHFELRKGSKPVDPTIYMAGT